MQEAYLFGGISYWTNYTIGRDDRQVFRPEMPSLQYLWVFNV